MVQRHEATAGPVAVGGRTITLVARTRAVHVGRGNTHALHVRARPAHVEVLEPDGRRSIVRIRDVERMLIASIAGVGTAYVLAVHLLRRARPR
jgi:hypothetical protein